MMIITLVVKLLKIVSLFLLTLQRYGTFLILQSNRVKIGFQPSLKGKFDSYTMQIYVCFLHFSPRFAPNLGQTTGKVADGSF